MRKVLSMFVCALLLCMTVIGFAGCGSGKAVAGTIKVWWPGGSEAEQAAIKAAKEQYEELFPDITIEIIPQATTNFYMAYVNAIGGDDYPDMAYVDHVYVQQLAYSRVNKPKIVNFTQAGVSDIKDKFIDSLWSPNALNNEIYALPFSANTPVLVYNKTLLKKVKPDFNEATDIPTTYEQMLEWCDRFDAYRAAASGRSGVYCYTIPAGSGNESMSAMSFLSYVGREGGNVISSDLKTMTLSTEAVRNAADKVNAFGAHDSVPATFQEGAFENGNVGFMEMGSWKISSYARIAGQQNIEFGYSPVISFKESVGAVSGLGLFSLVATEKSINKDITVDFIKWLSTNDELQLLHNTEQGLMPTTKAAMQNEFYSGDVWNTYKSQLNSIIARPGSPEWAFMESEFAGYMSGLLRNDYNKDDLGGLNRKIQNVLDELYEE